jgi:hypothetical protein
MKLKKHLLSISLVLLVSSLGINAAHAQFGKDFKEEEQKHMARRIFTGGSLGFWIYSTDGYVYVSPIVGYHISPSFDVGLRFTYSYYWYNDNFFKFNLDSYGGGIFGRYYLFFFRDLFIHLEYEYLSQEQPKYFNYVTGDVKLERIPINNYYVGAGFRQWLSPSAFLGITVLFNLNEQIEYTARNPIIRIGFGVGL